VGLITARLGSEKEPRKRKRTKTVGHKGGGGGHKGGGFLILGFKQGGALEEGYSWGWEKMLPYQKVVKGQVQHCFYSWVGEKAAWGGDETKMCAEPTRARETK